MIGAAAGLLQGIESRLTKAGLTEVSVVAGALSGLDGLPGLPQPQRVAGAPSAPPQRPGHKQPRPDGLQQPCGCPDRAYILRGSVPDRERGLRGPVPDREKGLRDRPPPCLSPPEGKGEEGG